MAVLLASLLLSWLIPQQNAVSPTNNNRELWLATLPEAIQPWGEPLFLLGVSHLFGSIWVWLPAAFLLLNSLVALAEHTPGAWQRAQAKLPPIEWQHALAKRAEYSTRLPEAPDKFLEGLKTLVQQKAFFLYENNQMEQRFIGATRRRWAWLAPSLFYVGLLLFIAGLILSYYFLQADTFTLSPQEPKSNRLFAGQFKLGSITPSGGSNKITFSPVPGQDTPQSGAIELPWRLFQPVFLQQTVLLPWAIEPIMTVEAKNKAGQLQRLLPSQENLAPAERLYLRLDQTNSPLYFSIPSAKLAFQVTPDPTTTATFNIQVRQGPELSFVSQVQAQAGKFFEVDQLSLVLNRDYNLKILAYRDPGLPFYILALIIVAGSSVVIIWFSPTQLWFVPEVKGRGGQFYGVIEQFGSVLQGPLFLEQLCTQAAATLSDNESEVTDSK